jgi:hypothetical protein
MLSSDKKKIVYSKLLQQEMHVGRIFCDLAKAFDFMNNEILLAKLLFNGIRGESEDCFSFYSTTRRQKFEVTLPTSSQNFSLTGLH